ncbi:MAG: hypothetical protein CBD27_10630 [Rhodospirillaceae bacterium TMED167]|nr:hypothetical protein [Rhodospirillaceae bacterium]OUW24838.1 MAG: hypothetical protein CBD27_10630 [Rhodospirillaceae bacterium TMED167]
MSVCCSNNKIILGYSDIFVLSDIALAIFIDGIQQNHLEPQEAEHRLRAQAHKNKPDQQTHHTEKGKAPPHKRQSIGNNRRQSDFQMHGWDTRFRWVWYLIDY